jgi:hypothetical protein
VLSLENYGEGVCAPTSVVSTPLRSMLSDLEIPMTILNKHEATRFSNLDQKIFEAFLNGTDTQKIIVLDGVVSRLVRHLAEIKEMPFSACIDEGCDLKDGCFSSVEADECFENFRRMVCEFDEFLQEMVFRLPSDPGRLRAGAHELAQETLARARRLSAASDQGW